MATTTTSRERESRRAKCPATAVLPTRLPLPITARAGTSNGSNSTGSKRKSAPTYGSPAASTRLASAKRRRASSTGSSERSSTTSGRVAVSPARGRRTGDAVLVPAAQLLGPTEHDGADDVERGLPKGGAHDVRVVLAVDERERLHGLLVTSSSIRDVYFSNSSVSAENWMIRSCPWYGYLRHTSTCRPSISMRL